MTSGRLEPPHDAFLDLAERAVLQAFQAMEGGAPRAAWAELAGWLDGADADLPIKRLREGFVLEPASFGLLALLFAAALSEPVARRVAAAGGAGKGVPLWLAQRLVPDLRADHCAASGVLLRFGLIDREPEALRIEARLALREAVLDRLSGVAAIEPEVAARIAPVPADLAKTPPGLARSLGSAMASRGAGGVPPVILAGPAAVDLVAAAMASLGLTPYLLDESDLPDDPEARDRLARFWSREAALDGAALIVAAASQSGAALADFTDRVVGHTVIAGPRAARGFRRSVRLLDDGGVVARPFDGWVTQLGAARARKLGAGVARVAAQFRLEPAEIDAVCAKLAGEIDTAPDGEAALRLLWHAAGRATIVGMLPGVTVVEPAYTWDDIVLAPAVEATLRRIEAHVRHATTVLDDWGFSARMGGRGRGVVALFAGSSGTGKTMAAEVLATALDLRMMVIDLSQIISKYIGETSKNIAAAFEQAERSGAVMVWNEGDAIWGTRGSVGSATDRHVNAEVGDLLQRIESFRGFTIVTTNMRHAIDPAFLRRFRFVVDFPMPSESERLRLWQQAFPAAAPLSTINWQALAPVPLSGSAIRNVALGSAFQAAKNNVRIDANLIAAELADEMRKQNLPVPAIDWGRS